MKTRVIQAKTLLAHVKQPDTWFGLKYNMNLYRGCQHRCIYCDSRSNCYQIEHFDREVLIKTNALELLADELSRKRVKGTIGTGSMNDPYMPLEKHINLTGQALAIIAQHKFPVHVLTKSDLVLKDLDTLEAINQVFATISFTITTTDNELARKVEPGAPRPLARLRAMEKIAARGIPTGTLLMPVLPFLEDSEDNIIDIVQRTKDAGGHYILASMGMTCRDGQREYYYRQLDHHFPWTRTQHHNKFGSAYFCEAQNAGRLYQVFHEACERYGVATQIPVYHPQEGKQLPLF